MTFESLDKEKERKVESVLPPLWLFISLSEQSLFRVKRCQIRNRFWLCRRLLQ